MHNYLMYNCYFTNIYVFNQCWGKLFLKVSCYNIVLLPKKSNVLRVFSTWAGLACFFNNKKFYYWQM